MWTALCENYDLWHLHTNTTNIWSLAWGSISGCSSTSSPSQIHNPTQCPHNCLNQTTPNLFSTQHQRLHKSSLLNTWWLWRSEDNGQRNLYSLVPSYFGLGSYQTCGLDIGAGTKSLPNLTRQTCVCFLSLPFGWGLHSWRFIAKELAHARFDRQTRVWRLLLIATLTTNCTPKT